MNFSSLFRVYTCLFLILGSSLLLAEPVTPPPRTVAIMAPRPVTSGWGKMPPNMGFLYAAGTLLSEATAAVPDLTPVSWNKSASMFGLVQSGLYEFQQDNAWQQWRELLQADIFVELRIADDLRSFEYAVHTARSSKINHIDHPDRAPKAAIAKMVKDLFLVAGVTLPKSLQQQLDDPECTSPELFLLWAQWDNFKPSIYAYDEDPWKRPSKAAQEIVRGDPNFKRGLAWALPMLLKGVDTSIPGKRRPANPSMFDFNVLRVLDSRFATRVLSVYNQRLRKKPLLLRDSLHILSIPGKTLDINLDDLGDDDDDGMLPDGGPKTDQAAPPKTTPLLRKNICLALSGIESREVIERLGIMLSEDPLAAVRAAAAQSLGGFRPKKKVITLLLAALHDDPDAAVRVATIQALGRLKQTKQPAIQAALRDPVVSVRQAAMKMLLKATHEKKAAHALIFELLRGKNTEFRILALEKIPEAFKQIKPLLPLLKASLKRQNPLEQQAALRVVNAFKAQALAEDLPPLFHAADPQVRAAAAQLYHQFNPAATERIIQALIHDTSEAVQLVLAKLASTVTDAKAKQQIIGRLLGSSFLSVRKAASNASYKFFADRPVSLTRAMLADPSLRTNLAALWSIVRSRDPALTALLLDTARQHPNEYIRSRALRFLAQQKNPAAHDLALRALRSPYFMVRLTAAGILRKQATPNDSKIIRAALKRTKNNWLKLPLEDALAKSTGQPGPKRITLPLGKRNHTEGGAVAGGFQVWLGDMPSDPKQARKQVLKGYRFGAVIPPPPSSSMWRMRTWNDGIGPRNRYLLHLLHAIKTLEKSAPNLYYICLFDEPHTPGGGNSADERHAFFLEMGRPDLLGNKVIPPKLSIAWRYWNERNLADLSNWVVGILRQSFQLKYPDIHLFPQTMTYISGSVPDVFDLIDSDGDYSWRYDYHNLMGHYGKGALMRAMQPGKPMCMVTRIGTYRPNFFHIDEVYPDTRFRPGPWRLTNCIATRAALALYASGVEAAYFNVVGYKSLSTRGRDTGGIRTYPLTPWSPALTQVINRMFARDKVFYWNKVRAKIELDILQRQDKTKGKDRKNDVTIDEPTDEPDELMELDDEKGAAEKEINQRYNALVQENFNRLMIGCSWMNIFNADNSRAMSNLPLPNAAHQPTLVILDHDAAFNRDAATFPLPALALAAGFDLVSGYACMRSVDLAPYDTIMIKAGPAGVTGTLVDKINRWLRTGKKLLIVNGDLNSQTTLLPRLLADPPKNAFPWEKSVTATTLPLIKKTIIDRRKKTRVIQVHPPISTFQPRGGKAIPDSLTTLWCAYKGPLDARIKSDGKTVLGVWREPKLNGSFILFDGAANAGPVYTEQLEKTVLALDRERHASIRRNKYWGHITLVTDAFELDVATSGYQALQKARPWKHRGIDIFYGVIDPEIVSSNATLILKDYIGPYAGGKGNWAVMAREQLVSMKLTSPTRLKLQTRGVTRVTYRGKKTIRLLDPTGFKTVENQLEVWKYMWQKKKAFFCYAIPGGWELTFQSSTPVTIVAE